MEINNEVAQFLNLRRLPGRLTISQTAWLLGVGVHDIPVLVKAGIIEPLGDPEPNAPKYFAATKIENLVQSGADLERLTKAITKRWRNKNHFQRKREDHKPERGDRTGQMPEDQPSVLVQEAA